MYVDYFMYVSICVWCVYMCDCVCVGVGVSIGVGVNVWGYVSYISCTLVILRVYT